jgi:hypothetical protein
MKIDNGDFLGKETKSFNLRMGNTNNLNPALCFKFLQKGYDIAELLRTNNSEYFKDFLSKIDSISRLTWQQIINSSRKGIGCEKISVSAIKVTIPPFITKERDILSFCLSGLFRILGVREGKVLYIVWIDPKGEVYRHSHSKK